MKMEIDLLIKNAREKLLQAQFSHNEADRDSCYIHLRETHRMLTQYLEPAEIEKAKP